MCDEIPCHVPSDRPEPHVPDSVRRAFLKGTLALPLATVLAVPDLRAAEADRLETVTIDVPGSGSVSGALAVPEGDGPHPTVLLIHEWWGLNDQIKSVAAAFAREGFLALAIDLYAGEVASDRDTARRLVGGVDFALAENQLAAAITYLKGHVSGNGKVGTVGWCFGGGWSLNASIKAPVDATVIYYGRVTRSANDLKALSGPVLGHFGTLDRGINKEMVDGFEAQMTEAGHADTLSVHWYEADHGFANPTGSRYDEADAALAWERTLGFFKSNLL